MTDHAHDWRVADVRGNASVRVCALCKRIQVKPEGKRWRNTTQAEKDVIGFLAVLELYAMVLRFVGILKP